MVRCRLTALVAGLSLIVPATALAQDGARPARDEFPLRDYARASDADTATFEAPGTSGDDPAPIILGALLAMLAGGAATWFATLRGGGGLARPAPAVAAAGVDRALARPAAPQRLWAAVADEPPAVDLTPAFDAERARSGTAAQTPGAPAQPERAWAAEIGWHRVGDAAQFRVAAHPVDGEEPTELGASALLRWPPDGARSGQALTDAVKELDAALLAAGWTPLPRGGAWYARRYAWRPGAEPATDDARARTRHRELYDAAFERQADRTRRLRATISERIAPGPDDAADPAADHEEDRS